MTPAASSARADILSRIRAATGAAAPNPEAIAAEWTQIRREYVRAATGSAEARIELFEDRLRDYDAGVFRCDTAGLPNLIARLLIQRHKHRIAIPPGLPADWLPEGISFHQDDRAGLSAIDACDGVLTSATLAIAETGTIILQHSAGLQAPGQGRRALTLLPDYHLCVVRTGTIVQTVPEAVTLLQPTAGLATTFFSGPSATADIEMTRIKGVHGPRFVDVILLAPEH